MATSAAGLDAACGDIGKAASGFWNGFYVEALNSIAVTNRKTGFFYFARC